MQSLSRKNFELILYRAHLWMHWQPREQKILAVINKLLENNPKSIKRIVDVGCGTGELAPKITSRGLSYIGVDPDPASIAFAKNKLPILQLADFSIASAEKLPLDCENTDLILLNGVAHHLPESVITNFLASIAGAGYLLILDHDVVQQRSSLPSLVQSSIQKADRGKFLRELSYFKYLRSWNLRSLEQFLISPFGIPLWPYFCALYDHKTDS